MQLQNNSTKQLVLISLFVSTSLMLSYVENFIPIRLVFAFPGIKLGLANIVTLIAIDMLQVRKIYLMVVVRVMMASIFIGSVMSFWYSISGGLLSLTVMLALHILFKNKFSIVGISATGGVFHNIGQLIVLAVITNNKNISLVLAPKLMLAGLITGVFIGYVALYLKPFIVRAIK